MTSPVSVAVYARISSDQAGVGLGVARQLEDCEKLVAQLGWQVGEEYVDNDISASAYTRKRRPAYERMLADLRAGARDGVIVYHLDRLTRRPVELEDFIEVVDEAHVRAVRFVAGDADLGSGDGLLVARIMGAVAANESATKSRRILRKMDQVAASGMPHGGPLRPFGFEPDKVTIRESEAQVLREMVTRYVSGESLHSLARWLEESGVPTVTGRPWRTTSIRTQVVSPRIAGLREHRGEVVGLAAWEAIISPAMRDKALARQAEAKLTGRRTPRRYLLSGLLRCGKCGGKLFASPRGNSRRYVCLSGPDHGGCGRLSVVAPPLEKLVAAMVLHRLDSPAMAKVLAGHGSADVETAQLAEALADDETQLDELATMWAQKHLSTREWEAAKGPIKHRIDTTKRRLTQITRTDALDGLGTGEQLQQKWAGLNLDRQAAIVRTLVTHVTIAAGTPGARTLDQERIDVAWRL